MTLANVISKVFEKVLLSRLLPFLNTLPNQFGLKPKHGTEQCVFILKECLQYYVQHGSVVFTCYLDASMAFDKISHVLLFQKLLEIGVPMYLIRVLWFWYRNQMLCVRWNNEYSDKFYIQNGVRQGGILSPLLYNIYVNNLSKNLNKVPAGCCINNVLINHLMYADDVVLIAPSMKGLQKLIDQCFLYGQDHNISFNTTKTVCMAVSKKGGMAQRCEPCLYLGSERILCVDKHKYLGYIMSNDTSDNEDIQRQIRSLYVSANILRRKFYCCSDYIKIMLFKSYCSSMYGSSLWCHFSKSVFSRLRVAYNNSLRSLLGLPRWCSATQMFVLCDSMTFAANLRKSRHSLLKRLEHSGNVYTYYLFDFIGKNAFI